MILSPHEIAHVALNAWPDAASAKIAVAVCLAESGGNTEAMGRSKTGTSIGNRDHGLWQISGRWQGGKLMAISDWRDPWQNAAMACTIWEQAKKTFQPWSAFTSEAYLTYMPDAEIAMMAPFPPPVDLSLLRMTELLNMQVASRDQVEKIGRHFT